MKSNFKFLAIIAFVGLLFLSCEKDESTAPNAPTISGFEYGEGSTHSTEPIAYKGSDMHLEATINAEAVVSSITLSIHTHDVSPEEGEVSWNYEQEFTGATYQAINPNFHEHIDVPANIPAGEYHIELRVTDKLGNTTEVNGHIQVLDPITLDGFHIDHSVVRGKDFHAEFNINAVHGLHNIALDIHAHEITPAEGEEEWAFKKVYDTKYHEKTQIEFHEHIDVPATAPAGEYHMVFTLEDENGNTKEYETHITITKQ
ncbi:protein of unknown function [Arenibacter nanhaiticus]|uniref:DUF4625 domain-containing protein n=1 Tax=Arenibacter nanhaiticus TaxID=558155 RepID=A0A1M6MIN9_9FLAO|nr:DUF4625 domain-containing protein [Arenibacter nanhaiticus]SHJ83266.1 protein of unknown function [Arenibacter nanhaiticus]